MWVLFNPFVYLSTYHKKRFLTRFYASTKVYTMASNYSPTELLGKGTLLKEDFTAGVENTICLRKIGVSQDKALTGSTYLFMETRTYPDSPLPLYFSGSVFSGSNVYGGQTDNYTQGIYIPAEGVSEIKWTPAVDIVGADIYFKATGLISASINGNCVPTSFALYDGAYYEIDVYEG